LALAAFSAGFWTAHFRRASQQDALAPRLGQDSDPVKGFWATFIKEDPAPIIAYADAIFLLDGSTDLFRYRHGASDDRGARVDPHLARQFASNPALVAKAGPLYFDNGYTGTGDVAAVAMLTSLFTQMGAKPMVESSYDITTNDLKQHNVILLGSSFQNVAVAQLPTMGDFLYVAPGSLHDLWGGWIVNTHPQANERTDYRTERDPATGTLKADYALISFQPGIVPGHPHREPWWVGYERHGGGGPACNFEVGCRGPVESPLGFKKGEPGREDTGLPGSAAREPGEGLPGSGYPAADGSSAQSREARRAATVAG
jgi:hypothetical protein